MPVTNSNNVPISLSFACRKILVAAAPSCRARRNSPLNGTSATVASIGAVNTPPLTLTFNEASRTDVSALTISRITNVRSASKLDRATKFRIGLSMSIGSPLVAGAVFADALLSVACTAEARNPASNRGTSIAPRSRRRAPEVSTSSSPVNFVRPISPERLSTRYAPSPSLMRPRILNDRIGGNWRALRASNSFMSSEVNVNSRARPFAFNGSVTSPTIVSLVPAASTDVSTCHSDLSSISVAKLSAPTVTVNGTS